MEIIAYYWSKAPEIYVLGVIETRNLGPLKNVILGWCRFFIWLSFYMIIDRFPNLRQYWLYDYKHGNKSAGYTKKDSARPTSLANQPAKKD